MFRSTLEIGHWAFDIRLHLFSELEICELIEDLSLFTISMSNFQ